MMVNVFDKTINIFQYHISWMTKSKCQFLSFHKKIMNLKNSPNFLIPLIITSTLLLSIIRVNAQEWRFSDWRFTYAKGETIFVSPDRAHEQWGQVASRCSEKNGHLEWKNNEKTCIAN
jgi:hypothetical protein